MHYIPYITDFKGQILLFSTKICNDFISSHLKMALMIPNSCPYVSDLESSSIVQHNVLLVVKASVNPWFVARGPVVW